MCFAQKSYRFESITVDDGLSQSGALCMVQDKLGYLWIGTQDGLNRYDGYSFEVFRHKEGDSTTLPKNYIINLFLDHENDLWVGTLGYLSKYNAATGTFTNYRVLPNTDPIRIFVCRDRSFAITSGEELLFFNPETERLFTKKEFKHLKKVWDYVETKSEGDWIFAEKTLHKFQNEKDWKETSVSGLPIFSERMDQLIISNNNGFSKFNNQTNSWNIFIKEGGEFMTKVSTNYWVGGQDGINVHDSLGRLVQHIPAQAITPGSNLTYINSMYTTRDGVVWIGTNGYGLKKYNPQTNRFGLIDTSPNSTYRLSHAYVDAIYTENDTTIYVSTPAGLDIVNLKDGKSQHLSFPTRIYRMSMDKSGALWCNAAGGLYKLKNNQFTKMHDWKDFYKTDLMPDELDIEWIREINKIETVSSAGLITPQLIIEDSLWTNYGGVGVHHTYDKLTIASISTGKILQQFTYDPGSPTSAPRSASIKIIFCDSRNNIWIGSNSEGLCLYNFQQNNFTHYTDKDGLPNNVVYGILEDDSHNLWLSTNKGLCEFNPVTKRVRNFDVYDGLQSNEFNTGAYFKSASGKMYFGGVNGVTYFHPKEIVTSNSIPQSIISGYYVNNTLLKDYSGYVTEDNNKKNQVLTLQYDERDFGFDVVDIGFSLPGRSRYRYTLENYDNQWNDIGNLRHISFTNIPPGDYVFRIQSSDSYGNWETTGASITVTIQAPFWTNRWVWFGSGIFLLVSVVLVYYYKVNQLKWETKKLERIVGERTQKIQQQKDQIEAQNEELLAQASYLEEKNAELEKAKSLLEIEVKYVHQQQLLKSSIQTQEEERKRIAQDLHDELGAVLSIARMHLVQIQNMKLTDSAMPAGLQQARMLTETALATMRRISHDLMPPQLENFGLVKTLEAIVVQIQHSEKIIVDLHASDELPRWSMPVELALYRICMEMINNTLKHADATRICIDLQQMAGHIQFSYSDNGKGLPKVIKVGHGFKNIEARVSIIGGTLEMNNSTLGGFYATIKI